MWAGSASMPALRNLWLNARSVCIESIYCRGRIQKGNQNCLRDCGVTLSGLLLTNELCRVRLPQLSCFLTPRSLVITGAPVVAEKNFIDFDKDILIDFFLIFS